MARRSQRSAVLLAAFAALLVVGAVVLSLSAYTVDEREHAVVVKFGKPVASRTEPGLYWKVPFVEEVRRLPKTLQFYRTGETDKLQDLPTADGRKIEVSAYAVWKITDPMQFVKVLRTVENAEDRLVRARVRSEIRNVVTSVNLAEVVRSNDRTLTYTFGSDGRVADPTAPADDGETDGAALGDVVKIERGREELTKEIFEGIVAGLREGEGDAEALNRGVELVDVGISSIEFVPKVRKASFERFRTELESYATQYRTTGDLRKQEILNTTNAEVQRILGDGERQSRELRGKVDARNIREFARAIEETGDFYTFQKTLELYREALAGDTRLILTTDSDLLRMLKGVDPAEAVAEPETSGVAAAE